MTIDTSKLDYQVNEHFRLDAVRFYVPSSATYEDLIATGQIELLKSDSLRYWLMKYNQEVKRNDRVEQRDYQFVHSLVIPFLVKNENYLHNESLAYEFDAMCDRRISYNEAILVSNQLLLSIIENIIRYLLAV